MTLSSPSPQPNTPTQRGIDTRLVAALARLQAVKDAYDAGKATRDELLAASDAVRELRAVPMKSALDAYCGGVS